MRMNHNKIKICHIVYSFDKIGGLENGLINLINGLPVEKYHHIVCSLTSIGDIKERVSNTNVTFYELRKSAGNNILLPAKIYFILRKERVKIVHLRNWATMLEGFIASKMAGTHKIIYSEHGRHFEDIDENKRINTLIKKIIFHRVDTLLAVSASLTKEMKELYSIRRVITCIPNGVNSEIFAQKGKILSRNRLGLSMNEKIAGSVSRLVSGKNYDQLIDDFLSIDFPCKLIIVGDGPEMENLKKIVMENDHQGRVLLFGNRVDISDIMNCFDVFVFPSLSEGLSNVLLEAMACGLPIIAYDVGGNSELVVDNGGGYLIDQGDRISFIDKIIVLLNNDELRSRFGHYNRVRIEQQYSLNNMVSAYEKLYSI